MIFRLKLWVLSKITNYTTNTKEKFKLIGILHVKLMLVNIDEYFNFKTVKKNYTPTTWTSNRALHISHFNKGQKTQILMKILFSFYIILS